MSNNEAQNSECAQTLQAIQLIIDQEEVPMSYSLIEEHFAGCLDCCQERELLMMLKRIVSRACCSEEVSQEMRLRVTSTIVEIQAELPESSS